MTLHTHTDLEQGSEEWLAARRGMVTASVVGQLVTVKAPSAIDFECPSCGAEANGPCVSKRGPVAPIKTLHPERAAYAVEHKDEVESRIVPADGDVARGLIATLAAERITGWTDPMYVSDDMWRGVEDEPVARDLYSEHFAPVTEAGFMVRDFDGFSIGYSPDGLVGDDGLIEIKSRKSKRQVLTVVAEQPPIENMGQLQCGLLVTGRKWIDYCSYAGGMHFWKTRVYPDPRWLDAILAATSAAEDAIAGLIEKYETNVVGLPMTTRNVELEMVI